MKQKSVVTGKALLGSTLLILALMVLGYIMIFPLVHVAQEGEMVVGTDWRGNQVWVVRGELVGVKMLTDSVVITQGRLTCEVTHETGQLIICDFEANEADLEAVVDDGYIVQTDNHLHKFNFQGEEQWRVFGHFIAMTPNQDGVILSAYSYDGKVCVYEFDGTERWCSIGGHDTYLQPFSLTIPSSRERASIYSYEGDLIASKESFVDMQLLGIDVPENAVAIVMQNGNTIQTILSDYPETDITNYDTQWYRYSFDGYDIFVYGQNGIITEGGIILAVNGNLHEVQLGRMDIFMEAPEGYQFVYHPETRVRFRPTMSTTSFLEVATGDYTLAEVNISSREVVAIYNSRVVCNVYWRDETRTDPLPTDFGELYDLFQTDEVHFTSRTNDAYVPGGIAWVEDSELHIARSGEQHDFGFLLEPNQECQEGFRLSYGQDSVYTQNTVTGLVDVYSASYPRYFGRAIVLQEQSTVTIGNQTWTDTHAIRFNGSGAVLAQGFNTDGDYTHYLYVGYQGQVIVEADNINNGVNGLLTYEINDQWVVFDPQGGATIPLHFD